MCSIGDMTVVEQVKSVCFSANIENREGLHQFTVLIRAGQALGRRRADNG